ncbi:MAG: hypothetical protein SF069_02980 [Phycisphaerae bacterium]|nr:hypothetical protein [Phycisphaerae bacterium]
MRLAKLSDLKKAQGIATSDTSQDTYLQGILEMITAVFENYLGRRISYVASDTTEELDGGDRDIKLANWPISGGTSPGWGVSSVKEAADGDFAAATALTPPTQFRINRERGVLTRWPDASRWLSGTKTVQVVYRYGWIGPDDTPVDNVEVAPRDLANAALAQAAAYIQRKLEPLPTSVSPTGPGGSVAQSGDYSLVHGAKMVLDGRKRMW